MGRAGGTKGHVSQRFRSQRKVRSVVIFWTSCRRIADAGQVAPAAAPPIRGNVAWIGKSPRTPFLTGLLTGPHASTSSRQSTRPPAAGQERSGAGGRFWRE